MPTSDLKQFYKLLDTLPNPITFNELAFDEEGNPYDKILYVNQSFLNTIGYTTEDIPDDRTWFSTAYPDPAYQDYVSKEWFKAVEDSKNANRDLMAFPVKVHCKGGDDVWFNVTTQTEHTIDDKYRTIVFIQTDAPEQSKLDLDKKALELLDEQRLLKTIIDTAPTRIFWKDLDGVYLGCNRLFLEDAQLSCEEEIIGKTDFDMVWQEEAKLYRDDDKTVTSSGIPKLNYIETQTPLEGEPIVVSTSKVPLRGAQGEIVGILGVYQDITAEHKAKQKVQEHEKFMVVQSRQAAMGEMISMIAHQWKQPLSSITAAIANIKVKQALDNIGSDDIEKLTNSINHQVMYLAQTITDFSDFFKPDRAKEEISITKPIHQALVIIDKLIENNEIRLIEDYRTKRDLFTYAKELQQVFINVIKNSVDALLIQEVTTKEIHIRTYDDNDWVMIEISDNAGGVEDKILDRIFEPYFSTKFEKNGTGLGLYMSKTIIENHLQGTIECENRAKGALFTIKLPLNIDEVQ